MINYKGFPIQYDDYTYCIGTFSTTKLNEIHQLIDITLMSQLEEYYKDFNYDVEEFKSIDLLFNRHLKNVKNEIDGPMKFVRIMFDVKVSLDYKLNKIFPYMMNNGLNKDYWCVLWYIAKCSYKSDVMKNVFSIESSNGNDIKLSSIYLELISLNAWKG